MTDKHPEAVDDVERINTSSYKSAASQSFNKEGDNESDEYNSSTGVESGEVQHRTYKRRWFGLAQLTLLNFAIGWGYTAPHVVSTSATEWYNVSFPQLNILSIVGSFVFLVPAPFCIWILNKKGPKFSILLALCFMLVGNWIIYAGARTHNFGLNVAGTVIHALAEPFVITAPTRYSRLWFSDRGRTFATALASLAYPLGSGTGALSGPFMVAPDGPWTYDYQALVIAIIFTVAALPAPFLPKAPPGPPSNVAAAEKLGLLDSCKSLSRNGTFYLQFILFSVFAGSIQTVIGMTNQSIKPYGYKQTHAGFAIATMIFGGTFVSFIICPFIDRFKVHLPAIKYLIFGIAAAYTALPFIPQTHSLGGFLAVYLFIGIFSFVAEPCLLETQATWTHPVSPEFSSVLCWCGSQVWNACLTLIIGRGFLLKSPKGGQPKGSLLYGQIFLFAVCWAAVPCALLLGFWKFKKPLATMIKGNE